MKQYTTIKEEAKRLKRSERSLRDDIRVGRIPFYKLGGRILLVPDEVDEALARFRHSAVGEPRRSTAVMKIKAGNENQALAVS